MKRMIIILALAATLAGCRVGWGEDFEPTHLGYTLSQQASRQLRDHMGNVAVMRHFREYLSAVDDDERQAMHDRYFYSQRIVKRQEGVWHIIGGSEILIYTGDNLLSNPGDEWRFADVPSSGTVQKFATLSFSGDGTAESYAYISEPEDTRYDDSTWLEFELNVIPEESITGEQKSTVRFEVTSGFGHVGSYEMDFEVFETLHYDPDNRTFNKGRLRMMQEVDGVWYYPEAEYRGSNDVMIYGGKDNAYNRLYSDNYYNYYW